MYYLSIALYAILSVVMLLWFHYFFQNAKILKKADMAKHFLPSGGKKASRMSDCKPVSVPLFYGFPPSVVRLLSDCCPFNKRTTIGQQSDNKRTTDGETTVKWLINSKEALRRIFFFMHRGVIQKVCVNLPNVCYVNICTH